MIMTSERVGLYDKSYSPVFEDAQIMGFQSINSAKIAEHPIESGDLRADHRILMPRTVQLRITLTPDVASNAYEELRSAFYSSPPPEYVVKHSGGVIEHLVMQTMPHEEKSETPGRVDIVLTLREIMDFTATFEPLKAARKKDGSTAKRGKVTPAPKTGSTLHKWFG